MSILTGVYIFTIAVSVGIALLLVHFARLSSQPKVEYEKKKREALDRYIPSDEALKGVITEEISDIVESTPKSEEISDRLTDVFHKELARRSTVATQEVSKKYEKVIEEKTQNEEIVWKRYNKVLLEKKDTEAVIRSIAEGLVVVDANGKVVMMNPAAEQLLGTSKDDKIGQSIKGDVKREQLISLIKEPAAGARQEIEIVSQEDETKKILKSSSAVIENENGQTVGMVSVLSDITKQKELDELKSKFVANVSHELRTPLVAIEKSITLLLDGSTGKVSESQSQFLSIAERNIKRLGLLINDLLDLSKLEAGKMQFQPEVISIDNTIEESVMTFKTWAESKSVAIEKDIQEGLPQVNIDANRIIQVLNNLISNAIKFTPKDGTVTVAVALKEENSEIEVSVKDTGIGITKEDLPKIFDKFYQVGERVVTDVGGTGIGLSISKEIVEWHQGKIWVESEKDQGTRFVFTLPIHKETGG